MSHVDRLPYVEATILELFRYKTLSPLAFPRRTMKDTEVGGYFIPGQTTVRWITYDALAYTDLARDNNILSALCAIARLSVTRVDQSKTVGWMQF